MPWTGPGGKLANTIRGALAYARRIADQNVGTDREVMTILPKCRLLIGVTGSSGFASHDPCIESIFAVGAERQGLIFDGANIFGPGGAILVSP
jgi:hypothetical protein